jgi:hypothetical protein
VALHFAKVALTVDITLPAQSLEQHIAATPAVVASQLAHQVYEYEKQHGLGYYPAIDYFENNEGIEQELISALKSIAWVAYGMVRSEFQARLRPVFSALQFESIQAQAFTLPSVRPGNANVLNELTNHYNLSDFKVSLIATIIQRKEDTEAVEKMAESMIYRWLKEHFKTIQVTSVHAI